MEAALALPNTGQAITIDVGEAGDIHPKNKQDVGRRLGLVGRRVAYREPVVSSGPTYRSHTIDGSRVTLTFDHVERRSRDERAKRRSGRRSPSRGRTGSSSGLARGSRATTSSCRAIGCASPSRCATRGRTTRPSRISTAGRDCPLLPSARTRGESARPTGGGPTTRALASGRPQSSTTRARRRPSRRGREIALPALVRALSAHVLRRWTASCSSLRRLIAVPSLVHQLDLDAADRDVLAVLVVRVHRGQIRRTTARRSAGASSEQVHLAHEHAAAKDEDPSSAGPRIMLVARVQRSTGAACVRARRRAS